jgi:hypothetical protein
MSISLAILAALTLDSLPVSGETIIFADNFDRQDSDTLGQTSTGAYSWIETDPGSSGSTASSALIKNGKLVFSTDATSRAQVYVNYDLDNILNYRIDFDMTITGSGNFTTVQPRGSGSYLTMGWRFISNGSTVSIQYYDGNTTTALTGTFSTNVATAISITVMNNSASLKAGETIVDTARVLPRSAFNDVPDYLGFYDPANAGATIDNLVVTNLAPVPEPSSCAALLALGGALVSIVAKFHKRRQ